MFEKASRLKLRFPYKGWCAVEDLWDLGVKHLDSIFKELNSKLKDQAGESLLDVVKTKASKLIELKIEIVKHIVKVKLAEQEVSENRVLKAERKQKLLAIITAKQDESLHEMSVESLTKLIDEL